MSARTPGSADIVESALVEWFADRGSERLIGANQPVVLTGGDAVQLVKRGHLDVFLVPGGTGIGARHFLFRVEEGGLVPGMDIGTPASADVVLGVGVPGTIIRTLPLNHFEAQLEPGRPGELTQAAIDREVRRSVRNWVRRFSEGVTTGLRPRAGIGEVRDGVEREVRELTPGRCVLADGQLAVAPAEAIIVRVIRGAVAVHGEPSAAGTPNTSLVMTAPMWVVAAGEVELEVKPIASLSLSSDVWPALQHTNRLLLDEALAEIARESASDRATVARQVAADRRDLENAASGIGSLFGRRRTVKPDVGVGDELARACSLVGAAMGIRLVGDPSPSTGTRVDPRLRVRAIAETSLVRTRSVRLTGQWWRRDNGPLLGFTRDGRDPVALIPRGPGRYELFEPDESGSRRVDAGVAAGLEPEAFTFYRPFPARAMDVRRLIRFGLARTRRDIPVILLAGMAVGLIALLLPIVTGVLFDSVIPGHDTRTLWSLVFVLLGAALASGLFMLVRNLAVLRLEGRMQADLEPAVWDRLVALPASFFRDFTTGDLVARARGIADIRAILTGVAVGAILGVVFSLFSTILLFVYSPKLALLAVAAVTVINLTLLWTTFRQIRHQRVALREMGRIYGTLFQFLDSIAKLRVAAAESRAFAIWARKFRVQQAATIRATRLEIVNETISTVYSPVLSLLIFVAVGTALYDTMTAGGFIAFMVALGQFVGAVTAMTFVLRTLMRVVPLFERMEPILSALPEVESGMTGQVEVSGKIELSNVTFAYGSYSDPVIEGFDLEVQPGEFVAVTGSSGSGKSTILRLLLGLETPRSGTILYDGRDIRDLDLRSLRRQLGVVLQGAKPVPGDIFTNIVGATSLGIEAAWEAARRAGLEEFIRKLPMGMHTVVTEGGAAFSGGQIQRLLVARAIVHQPRIVLFDEATSFLDNEAQARVSEAIAGLDATRIVVAHRLSTVRRADRIVVLEHGRIVETGSFAELMTRRGLFAEQMERQLLDYP